MDTAPCSPSPLGTPAGTRLRLLALSVGELVEYFSDSQRLAARGAAAPSPLLADGTAAASP